MVFISFSYQNEGEARLWVVTFNHFCDRHDSASCSSSWKCESEAAATNLEWMEGCFSFDRVIMLSLRRSFSISSNTGTARRAANQVDCTLVQLDCLVSTHYHFKDQLMRHFYSRFTSWNMNWTGFVMYKRGLSWWRLCPVSDLSTRGPIENTTPKMNRGEKCGNKLTWLWSSQNSANKGNRIRSWRVEWLGIGTGIPSAGGTHCDLLSRYLF